MQAKTRTLQTRTLQTRTLQTRTLQTRTAETRIVKTKPVKNRVRQSIQLNSTAGLTIIEVLVSITLLTIIALAVITPLTGFFGLSRKSNESIAATQAAQQVIETIRGDWLNPKRYSQACWTTPLPKNINLSIKNLDATRTFIGNTPWKDNCNTLIVADESAMREITVIKTDDAGKGLAQLNVMVVHP